jgi:hypothetical protein
VSVSSVADLDPVASASFGVSGTISSPIFSCFPICVTLGDGKSDPDRHQNDANPQHWFVIDGQCSGPTIFWPPLSFSQLDVQTDPDPFIKQK